MGKMKYKEKKDLLIFHSIFFYLEIFYANKLIKI